MMAITRILAIVIVLSFIIWLFIAIPHYKDNPDIPLDYIWPALAIGGVIQGYIAYKLYYYPDC